MTDKTPVALAPEIRAALKRAREMEEAVKAAFPTYHESVQLTLRLYQKVIIDLEAEVKELRRRDALPRHELEIELDAEGRT